MAFSRAWSPLQGFHVYYDDNDNSADSAVFALHSCTPALQVEMNFLESSVMCKQYRSFYGTDVESS